MRIAFVADVIGKAGRGAVRRVVPGLRAGGADLVVCNGENAARGLGITPKLARELLASGADVITSGNHLFRRKEIAAYIASEPRLLRPHNYRTRAPGLGFIVVEAGGGAKAGAGVVGAGVGVKVGVMNLLGRTYMDHCDDPFAAADALLEGPLADVKIRILDFHAEATGEKRSMLYWLDGRVSALIGTHTHVQTADEQVTANGTAYITDAGMTGSVDSVIGMDPEPMIESIRTSLPRNYSPALSDPELQGVVVDIDEQTGKARSIERLRMPAPWPAAGSAPAGQPAREPGGGGGGGGGSGSGGDDD